MSTTRREPVFDCLEARTLMSGNVGAVLCWGRLTLVGDSAPNAITLTRDGNKVTVTPDATTSINGKAAGQAVDLLGVTGAITIRMGEGDDSVAVLGQVIGGVSKAFTLGGRAGDLDIDMGRGNDQVLLAGVDARNVTIDAGGGDNVVKITALNPDYAVGGPIDMRTTIRGSLSAAGGCGNDTVFLEGLDVAGRVGLDLGLGGNIALISPFKGDDTSFDVTIGGNFIYRSLRARQANVVVFDDPNDAGSIQIGGSLRMNLGRADDVAVVTPMAELSVGGSMFINGHLGSDTVVLTSATIGGQLAINTGAGTDWVSANNMRVGVAEWINGTPVSGDFNAVV